MFKHSFAEAGGRFTTPSFPVPNRLWTDAGFLTELFDGLSRLNAVFNDPFNNILRALG